MNNIKVGYVSSFAPNNRFASSGTNYKVVEQLKKCGEVTWIPITTPKIYRLFEIIAKILAKLLNKKIYFLYTKIGCKLFAKYQKVATEIEKYDIIFAFFNAAPFYDISTTKPIIYLTDATFPVMIDYYPPFYNLFRFNQRQGKIIEESIFNKFKAIICGSDWAAKSVVNDLHQSNKKVYTIEFGANIDTKDIVRHPAKYSGHLHILFLGVDWKRKGGDIAVKTCKLLIENNIQTTLHIVGIKNLNTEISHLSFVDNIGFLDKNIPQQYKHLLEIIKISHLLLLPTIAECAGIAFAEASAFGLPVFTYDTGGIPNYVSNGENGYKLPITSSEYDFYEKIKYCLETGALEKMSSKCVEIYNNKLNWNHWGGEVKKLMNSLLK